MKDKVLLIGIVYLTCHFVLNVILGGLAGSGAGKGSIFKHTVGEISNNHTIQVTPARYTFWIWNLIYLWLLAAYVYLNINIFRSCRISPEDNSRRNAAVFGRSVVLVLIINSIIYTAWLFLWDNDLMTLSAVALILIAITNWIALATYSASLWNSAADLKSKSPIDLMLHRILVQNGLATYTTWTTLAALINLAVAIADSGVNDPAPSLIALALLSVLMAIWIPVELLFWDNYFRYMITPLLVVLWGLAGIMVKQGEFLEDLNESVVTFTVVLIFGTSFLFLVRTGLTIYRHIKRPLYVGLSTTKNGSSDNDKL